MRNHRLITATCATVALAALAPAAQAHTTLARSGVRALELRISHVLREAGFVGSADRRDIDPTRARYLQEVDVRTYVARAGACADGTLLRDYLAEQFTPIAALHSPGAFIWRWRTPAGVVKLVLDVPQCGAPDAAGLTTVTLTVVRFSTAIDR